LIIVKPPSRILKLGPLGIERIPNRGHNTCGPHGNSLLICAVSIVRTTCKSSEIPSAGGVM
jgi:hypothetical protein